MFGPIAPPVSPARPRLLFLVTEDRFFWSHRLPIARAALRSGYEVIVATNVLRYEQEIQNEGFRLIPLRLIRKSSSPLNELRALHELRRITMQKNQTSFTILRSSRFYTARLRRWVAKTCRQSTPSPVWATWWLLRR